MVRNRQVLWLGRLDLNQRNAAVKVLCLTPWRRPNIRLKESHLNVLPDYTNRIERSLPARSQEARRITKMLMDLNQTFQVPLVGADGLEPSTTRLSGVYSTI